MRSISRQKISQRVAIQIGARVAKQILACVREPVEIQLSLHHLLVWEIGDPVWQQILGSPAKFLLVRPIYQQAKGGYNE